MGKHRTTEVDLYQENEILKQNGSTVEQWNGGTVEQWNSGTVERWNGSTFSTCTRKVQLLYIYTYIADQVKVFIVPRILT